MFKCDDPNCRVCDNPHYEWDDRQWLLNWLEKKSTKAGCFIDVGAHVGLWSIDVASFYRKCGVEYQIFAWEPDDFCCRLLIEQREHYPGITPILAAAWNKNGSGYYHGYGVNGYVTDRGTEKDAKVKLFTLDSLYDSVFKRKSHYRIDAIKVDVEGAELLVLQGAHQLLTDQYRMAVIVEYYPMRSRRYDLKHELITTFLLNHNFHFATNRDKRIAETIKPQQKFNVKFVKDVHE